MLDPEGRHLLIDALRPPYGYELNLAVGTTYTLDLYALLTAPVAFAKFDRETSDGTPWTDPVTALQALRRHSDHITLFCQAGEIKVPRDYRSLVVYLEPSIIPVVPPNPEAIFHPKVWFIRFRSTGAGPRFRLLCMSRNLTYDRSWDTMLRLEGEPSDTVHHPELREFTEALPTLADAVKPLADDRRAAIGELGVQLERVRWSAPEGMEIVRFWPLGYGGQARWPFTGRSDRFFVASPFVTAGALSRLTKGVRGSILLSRPETFDRLGGTATGHLRERLVLSADTREPTADAPEHDGASESPAAILEGLHAKLVVADIPYGGRVWTGSANLTDAAFGGNVEFVTELRGRKRSCGIGAIIGDQSTRLGLRKLVEPYEPASAEGRPLTETERLEEQLDRARRVLGRLRYRADCTSQGLGGFDLELSGVPPEGAPLDPTVLDGLTITIHPMTLGEGAATAVDPDPSGWTVRYRLSYDAITPFFAIRLRPTDETLGLEASFLVNAELVGAPGDRAENVMVGLLKDQAALIRFLLLLLGNVDEAVAAITGEGPSAWDGQGAWVSAAASEALLEPLVRAYSRDRTRLFEIQNLMIELSKTKGGREVLPGGWDAIWGPIEAALAREPQP